MLTYTLVTRSVSGPFVKVERMVIAPTDFPKWSETERDEWMLEYAANTLAAVLGHRPAYLDFDYFQVAQSANAG